MKRQADWYIFDNSLPMMLTTQVIENKLISLAIQMACYNESGNIFILDIIWFEKKCLRLIFSSLEPLSWLRTSSVILIVLSSLINRASINQVWL